jgi:hypothetical protein
VLLNKVDMLKEGDLESLSQIASSLNPLAKVGAATVQKVPFMPPLLPHERPLLAEMVGSISGMPVPGHVPATVGLQEPQGMAWHGMTLKL